jgi:hypothetical protein
MSTKHTPGPWKLIPYGENRWIVEAKSEDPILGEEPCMVLLFASEADARLTVATPELLDAAKQAIQALEIFQAGNPSGTLSMLKAAIAKAKGEE